MCELALKRIGCATSKHTISMGTADGTKPYTCACGTYTDSSTRIAEIIVDQLYSSTVSALPVFDQPFTFNTQFSLAFVFIFGKIGSIVAQIFYLPPVIGFLLTGMGMQDIITKTLIKGALGGAPFSEFRTFALVIVVMRAGLTLNPVEIYNKGYMTIVLSFLPYFAEFAAILAVTVHLYGWNSIDAGLFASIMAALSPSLVIPFMIQLVDKGYGFTTKCVLTSAPVEVVLAIILFNIFANLEVTEHSTVYPWVSVLPLYGNILLIPVNILYSIVIGCVSGVIITNYFSFRKSLAVAVKLRQEDEKRRIELKKQEDKNEEEAKKESDGKSDEDAEVVSEPAPLAAIHPVLITVARVTTDSTAEYTFVCIVTCYTIYSLCQPYYLQYSSGILAIFACMLTVSYRGDPTVNAGIKDALAGLWVFLEVILFTTTGINLSFKGVTGPLQSDRGISGTYLQDTVIIILTGISARAAGILATGAGGWHMQSPHRRNWKYFGLWCLSTFLFQLPKATVQATLGGLPYSQHMIAGTEGLKMGIYIQQATAFSVFLMAPIGSFLMVFFGEPIARWLRHNDEAHGEFAHKAIGGISVKVDDKKLNDEEVIPVRLSEDKDVTGENRNSEGSENGDIAMTSNGYATVAANDENDSEGIADSPVVSHQQE